MNKKLLLLSLQKSGGGAIDTLGLSNGLCANKIFHYLIISSDNELAERFIDNEFRKVYKIKTFKTSLLDFFIQTFIYCRFLRLIKIILNIKPDFIFVTHFNPWVSFVYLLKIFLKNKILYGIHDNPYDPKEKQKPFSIFLEKIFLKYADLIITYSNYIEKDIKRFIKSKKFLTIYLGTYKDLFPDYRKNFNIEKKELTLLFFGRILPYKGLDILLKAYENLRKKNLKIKLIIAGRGEVEKKVKEKIIDLGVIFKNHWISNDELLEILEESDVIVIPYKKGTQSAIISLGLACGFPIIASNVGSFSEFIIDGENGFLFESNNYLELAEKIEYLYFNRERLKKMGEASFKKGEEFSWQNTVKSLIKFLNEE
ncbi:MAG: glycosyltransferase family 4 protein [Candidatus Aenigmatarchaeota archaeon]